MPQQIVMDRTGDTRHDFGTADPVGLAEAEERFKELTGSGFMAAAVKPDGSHEIVHEFDPSADTLFIPALQGG